MKIKNDKTLPPSDFESYNILLPERMQKPRINGITAIHDVGIPLGELQILLDDFHSYVDIAKFGVGTAMVTPKLMEKISIYQSFGINPYFGGTLFEKFFYLKRIDKYLKLLNDFNINIIEVSNGTIDIPLKERIAFIKSLEDNFQVIAEVGSKDPDLLMPPSVWIEEVGSFFDLGCSYVILEGRDSASAGLYRPSGELRSGLLSDILSTFGPEKIIIEAPTAQSQMLFIKMLGANVNLGNVAPRDILLLEAQRRGLRNETFFVK